MVEKVQVLETPDYQKTIEELNEEIEPKMFSQSTGIESKARDKSLAEIFDYYNSIGRKQVKYDYLKDKKETNYKSDKLLMMETELQSIREELETQGRDINENSELHDEVSELGVMLEQLKEKIQRSNIQQSNKVKLNIPSTNAEESGDLTGGFTFEINLNDSEEKSRLSRLDNKVRELEYVVGNWKQYKPVNESLADFIAKTRFINSDLLEKITDQARHLGTDLDIMLSSRTSVQAAQDSVDSIKNLHRDTYSHITQVFNLPHLIDKIKFSAPIYAEHLKLDTQMLDLEAASENLLSEITQSTGICEELRTGIEANKDVISNNMALLNQKIK